MLTRATRDPYAELGVPRDADPDALRRAFRARAAEVHPDVSDDPRAAERFRRLVEAYELLSDPDGRARYDRLRSPWAAGAPRAPAPGGAPIDDLADLVAAARAPARGADVHVELQLDAREARRGAIRAVRFQATGPCTECGGRGWPAGEAPSTCATCRGSRRIREEAAGRAGRVLRLVPCPACGGRGIAVGTLCASCGGDGQGASERALLVTTPEGAVDGLELRLEGHGAASASGGDPGDVVVTLRVQAPPSPRRARR